LGAGFSIIYAAKARSQITSLFRSQTWPDGIAIALSDKMRCQDTQGESFMSVSTDQVSSKVLKRLVPFIMLLFFISLLDRANISYAALQMNKDLGLGPSAYGFAAGIFFVGYFLFEIPSNIALAKIGARKWLGRIMITWGLVAIAMAWVSGAASLYSLRFLLGVAEAGLLPGVMFYLARWIPGRARGATLSVLMATTAIAYVIGAPLSTWLMSFNGVLGLRGWQLMFVVEGIPAVIFGIVTLAILPETPFEAKWLTGPEREALSHAIAQESEAKQAHGPSSMWQGLTDRRILLAFGQISNMEVGLLSAIPYALGGVGMIIWGRHSDQTGERRWHLFAGAALAAIGYAAAAFAPGPAYAFIAICLAAIGIWSTFGLLWAYAGDLVAGPAAATGFAIINSIGSAGGFVGPFLIGWVRGHTHGFSGSLLTLAAFGAFTALFALLLRGRPIPTARETLVASADPMLTAE
jgi:ACS family tartrate transporter-like MFS transporter